MPLKPSPIDVALGRFVKRPSHLRAILSSTNAIISGSFAVQYFLNETWSSSDLDIDISADDPSSSELTWTKAQRLIDHLTQVENYDCAKQATQYHANDIETVMTFYAPPHHSAFYGSPMIQVVLVRSDVVQHILTTYYATHILNFITGRRAYCLYPELLERRKSFLLRDPGMYREFFERKYGRDRGFELIEPETWFGVGERVIGDERTIVINFEGLEQDRDVNVEEVGCHAMRERGIVGGVAFKIERHNYGTDGQRSGLRVSTLGWTAGSLL